MNAVLPGPAAPQPVLDAAAFQAWLGAAHPGSRITYHRGHLIVDRESRPDAVDAEARTTLSRLAGQAMRGPPSRASSTSCSSATAPPTTATSRSAPGGRRRA